MSKLYSFDAIKVSAGYKLVGKNGVVVCKYTYDALGDNPQDVLAEVVNSILAVGGLYEDDSLDALSPLSDGAAFRVSVPYLEPVAVDAPDTGIFISSTTVDGQKIPVAVVCLNDDEGNPTIAFSLLRFGADDWRFRYIAPGMTLQVLANIGELATRQAECHYQDSLLEDA